jgi:hypothetical protein
MTGLISKICHSVADSQHVKSAHSDEDMRRDWIASVAKAINAALASSLPEAHRQTQSEPRHLCVSATDRIVRMTVKGFIQISIGVTSGYEVVHFALPADAQFAVTVCDLAEALLLVDALVASTSTVLHRAIQVST